MNIRRYACFAVAGGAGFLTDAGVLTILTLDEALHPLLARLASMGCALLVTWMVNRNLTFGPSERGVAREGMRYGGVGISSSIVNYLVFSGLVLAVSDIPPVAALVVSSASATLISWFGYSRLVFDR